MTPSKRTLRLGALAVMLLALAARLSRAFAVFQGDEVVPLDGDSARHLFRMQAAARDALDVPSFDPWGNWPHGAFEPWAPGFDVVGALIGLVKEPRAIGDVFNVGNDQEISIRALAERIKTMTHSASEIVTLPYDQVYEAGFEDMARRIPDLSKIRKLIGYEPTVQLDRIIDEVVDYARQHR